MRATVSWLVVADGVGFVVGFIVGFIVDDRVVGVAIVVLDVMALLLISFFLRLLLGVVGMTAMVLMSLSRGNSILRIIVLQLYFLAHIVVTCLLCHTSPIGYDTSPIINYASRVHHDLLLR